MSRARDRRGPLPLVAASSLWMATALNWPLCSKRCPG